MHAPRAALRALALLCIAMAALGGPSNATQDDEAHDVYEEDFPRRLEPTQLNVILGLAVGTGVIAISVLITGFRYKLRLPLVILLVVWTGLLAVALAVWAVTLIAMRSSVQNTVEGILSATAAHLRVSLTRELAVGADLLGTVQAASLRELIDPAAAWPFNSLLLRQKMEAMGVTNSSMVEAVFYGTIFGTVEHVSSHSAIDTEFKLMAFGSAGAQDPSASTDLSINVAGTGRDFVLANPANLACCDVMRDLNEDTCVTQRECGDCGVFCPVGDCDPRYFRQVYADFDRKARGFTNFTGQWCWDDPSYVVTSRPWFTRSRGNTWTEPYVYGGGLKNRVGVTVSRGVYGVRDEFLGALGVDFSLDTMARFLRASRPTNATVIAVYDASGLVLASSMLPAELIEDLGATTEDGFPRTLQSLADLNATRATNRHSVLRRAFDAWEGIPEQNHGIVPRSATLYANGDVILAQIVGTVGFSCILVTFFPAEAVIGQVHTLFFDAFLWSIGMSVCASVAVVIFAVVMVRPLRVLADDMDSVANMRAQATAPKTTDGDGDPSAGTSYIKEIYSMQRSFNYMAMHIREYRKYLPHHVLMSPHMDGSGEAASGSGSIDAFNSMRDPSEDGSASLSLSLSPTQRSAPSPNSRGRRPRQTQRLQSLVMQQDGAGSESGQSGSGSSQRQSPTFPHRRRGKRPPAFTSGSGTDDEGAVGRLADEHCSPCRPFSEQYPQASPGNRHAAAHRVVSTDTIRAQPSVSTFNMSPPAEVDRLSSVPRAESFDTMPAMAPRGAAARRDSDAKNNPLTEFDAVIFSDDGGRDVACCDISDAGDRASRQGSTVLGSPSIPFVESEYAGGSSSPAHSLLLMRARSTFGSESVADVTRTASNSPVPQSSASRESEDPGSMQPTTQPVETPASVGLEASVPELAGPGTPAATGERGVTPIDDPVPAVDVGSRSRNTSSAMSREDIALVVDSEWESRSAPITVSPRRRDSPQRLPDGTANEADASGYLHAGYEADNASGVRSLLSLMSTNSFDRPGSGKLSDSESPVRPVSPEVPQQVVLRWSRPAAVPHERPSLADTAIETTCGDEHAAVGDATTAPPPELVTSLVPSPRSTEGAGAETAAESPVNTPIDGVEPPPPAGTDGPPAERGEADGTNGSAVQGAEEASADGGEGAAEAVEESRQPRDSDESEGAHRPADGAAADAEEDDTPHGTAAAAAAGAEAEAPPAPTPQVLHPAPDVPEVRIQQSTPRSFEQTSPRAAADAMPAVSDASTCDAGSRRGSESSSDAVGPLTRARRSRISNNKRGAALTRKEVNRRNARKLMDRHFPSPSRGLVESTSNDSIATFTSSNDSEHRSPRLSPRSPRRLSSPRINRRINSLGGVLAAADVPPLPDAPAGGKGDAGKGEDAGLPIPTQRTTSCTSMDSMMGAQLLKNTSMCTSESIGSDVGGIHGWRAPKPGTPGAGVIERPFRASPWSFDDSDVQRARKRDAVQEPSGAPGAQRTRSKSCPESPVRQVVDEFPPHPRQLASRRDVLPPLPTPSGRPDDAPKDSSTTFVTVSDLYEDRARRPGPGPRRRSDVIAGLRRWAAPGGDSSGDDAPVRRPVMSDADAGPHPLRRRERRPIRVSTSQNSMSDGENVSVHSPHRPATDTDTDAATAPLDPRQSPPASASESDGARAGRGILRYRSQGSLMSEPSLSSRMSSMHSFGVDSTRGDSTYRTRVKKRVSFRDPFVLQLVRRSVTIAVLNLSLATARNSDLARSQAQQSMFVEKHSRCFETIVMCVKVFSGVVDTFHGDKVCASFNAAIACGRHMYNAVRCTQQIVQTLTPPPMFSSQSLSSMLYSEAQASDAKTQSPPAQMLPMPSAIGDNWTIAVNGGVSASKALCGNLGCVGMRQYSVLGGAGSVAAVLERWGYEWGIPVLIDERVSHSAQGIPCRAINAVRNKDGDVFLIYELLPPIRRDPAEGEPLPYSYYNQSVWALSRGKYQVAFKFWAQEQTLVKNTSPPDHARHVRELSEWMNHCSEAHPQRGPMPLPLHWPAPHLFPSVQQDDELCPSAAQARRASHTENRRSLRGSPRAKKLPQRQ